ncbi:MAG: hypothetical protein R3C68_19275 [Myxococcota bacterium]
MRAGKRTPIAEPGVFKPPPPADSQEVLRLFAVAARAACAKPDRVEDITGTLKAATAQLVPPEKTAAEECGRLWQLFLRVAKMPKDTLRIEASKALHRDLDAIGQRLDLPPLANWESIPAGIDDPKGVVASTDMWEEGLTADEVRERASKKKRKKEAFLAAPEVLKLLVAASAKAREEMLQTATRKGAINRGEATLMARVVLQKGTLGPDDEMLKEALENFSKWLL